MSPDSHEAIFIVQEDCLPRVAVTYHMVDRTRILDSQRPCHEDSLAQVVYLQDLTLYFPRTLLVSFVTTEGVCYESLNPFGMRQ